MARLDARWFNFAARGQVWDHFWQDASAAGGSTAYTLVADAGTFALSGAAVGTKVARKLPATPGAFAFAGSTVALKAARKLQAVAGAFTLTGADVGLTYTPGGAPPATVRRYYHGRVAHAAAVKLSKRVYYVDE